MSENITPELNNSTTETPVTESSFTEPEVVDAAEAEETVSEDTVTGMTGNNTEDVAVKPDDSMTESGTFAEPVKPQPSYYQYNPEMNNTYAEPEEPQGKGLAIAGMVCGIVALVMICCLWPIAVILGIAGLALSIIALVKKQSKGMSIAGIITSGLALLFSIALVILSVAFVDIVSDVMSDPEFQKQMEYELEYDLTEEQMEILDQLFDE